MVIFSFNFIDISHLSSYLKIKIILLNIHNENLKYGNNLDIIAHWPSVKNISNFSWSIHLNS